MLQGFPAFVFISQAWMFSWALRRLSPAESTWKARESQRWGFVGLVTRSNEDAARTGMAGMRSQSSPHL